MELTLEIERESDGRWLAEVPELPGVLAYGRTRALAERAAQVLSFHVNADRMEHSEMPAGPVSVVFLTTP
jgi:predicted RNase H-like HicB family nuclease